jgi:enoyl-CoA hydratase
MTVTAIDVERCENRTALLTIARPAKRNAMNRAFFRELHELLAKLDADPEIVAAVITGAGDEAFSAGGDVVDFHAVTSVQAAREQARAALGAFSAIERAETVVIAAVNGIAYGGGTEITLACDLALASDRARFAFREVTLGLMPSYGLVRGPEVIGRGWTRRLAFTGEIVDAECARRIGLVEEVVPHERLLDEALALAARIGSHPALAIGAGKRFLNRELQGNGLPEAVELTALLFGSDEHRAAVRAFLEPRGGVPSEDGTPGRP